MRICFVEIGLVKRILYYIVFSKRINFDDRTRFCGYSNKFERPVKLPIKEDVNMIYASIWFLFMFQCHIMTWFHFNILKTWKENVKISWMCANPFFRYLYCSANIFHGHSYIGQFTSESHHLFGLKITVLLHK